jgi:hypothetical protein
MRERIEKLDNKTGRRLWPVAAIAGVAILGAATGALARDHDDDEGNWKHHGRGYYAPYYVAVPPGHVRYYYPPPVVVYPAPVYYAPPPVYYGPPPGLNINLAVPLR